MTEDKPGPDRILDQAVEISDLTERKAFLDEACGGDETLRAEVESLLAAYVESGDFLDAPAIDSEVTLEAAGPAEGIGETIGRYKLLEKIGEGGMAVVYTAEQKRPIRRRVAVKLIKLGMDSKQVIARFEAERQALALMDHPNIAKVLDAGTTEAGRPYFVMELVRGIAITDYCDQEKLPTQKRLDLFIKVCHAIQHAHQKGIIHRDIKPSNILVTLHDGVPVPKVIDFGIAKATQQELTAKTVYTQFQQFIGTPAYMSPEQAEMSGLDIDTRSDIYSLGVLLYELLTGATPFDTQDLMRAGIDQMRKMIRETEPYRPSTKVATLKDTEKTSTALRQSTEFAKLVSILRGDLDWIVMKCLEKDRTRRYDTASGLSMELQRYLSHEVVTARPPSALYRFQKAWRRNKLAYSAGMAVALALVVGISVSLWQASVAHQAHGEAEQARLGEQKQRIASQEEARRATEAEQRETQLRSNAEEQELKARRRAYAADMLLCRQALKNNNLRRARQLLDRQHPKDGEEDLRDWEWRYLWRGCQGDALLKLDMQGERTFKAVFVGDGKSVLTFAGRGKVGLWNLAKRAQEAIFQGAWPADQGGPSSSSGQLCVSADGEWVVAWNRDPDEGSGVRIWELSTRKIIAELIIDATYIISLDISPDKKTIAVHPLWEGASIWDIASGRKLKQMSASRGGAVRYSPDGTILAIGADKGRVQLIHADTADEKTAFSAVSGGGFVKALDFSPTGRFLAVGTGFLSPCITIWDLEANTRVTTLEGHSGFIPHVAFSPDGQHLASASGDQTVKLWNTRDWSEESTLLGHTDEVWSVGFSHDGEHLVSSSKDGHVCVWDTPSKLRNRGSIGLPAGIQHVDVSPDGKTIVAVLNEGAVQLMETATLKKRPVPVSLGTNNVAVFWTTAQEILLGSQEPPMIKAWNLSTNTVSTFELGLDGQEFWFEYFPDSSVLAATVLHSDTKGKTIMRWDVSTHKTLSSYTIEDVPKSSAVAISQDAHWLAAQRGPRVEVVNLLTGQQVCDLSESKVHYGLALSPDGQRVMVATHEAPIVNIWDVSTQEKMISLQGHSMVVSDIAISADGRRMATATIGREPIKLWDTTSWEEVGSLDGDGRPGFPIYFPVYLSDGNTIAAREEDMENVTETFRLWQAPSWEEVEAAESADNSRKAGE